MRQDLLKQFFHRTGACQHYLVYDSLAVRVEIGPFHAVHDDLQVVIAALFRVALESILGLSPAPVPVLNLYRFAVLDFRCAQSRNSNSMVITIDYY